MTQFAVLRQPGDSPGSTHCRVRAFTERKQADIGDLTEAIERGAQLLNGLVVGTPDHYSVADYVFSIPSEPQGEAAAIAIANSQIIQNLALVFSDIAVVWDRVKRLRQQSAREYAEMPEMLELAVRMAGYDLNNISQIYFGSAQILQRGFIKDKYIDKTLEGAAIFKAFGMAMLYMATRDTDYVYGVPVSKAGKVIGAKEVIFDSQLLDSNLSNLSCVLATQLVKNARKYAGSEPEVRIQQVRMLGIPYTQVSCTDEGRGILGPDRTPMREENLQLLFDPNYSTGRDDGNHNTGLGLGLVGALARFYGVATRTSAGTAAYSTFPETMQMQPLARQGTVFTFIEPVNQSLLGNKEVEQYRGEKSQQPKNQ